MMSQAPLPLYLDVHNARAQGIGPPFKPRRQAVTGIVLQTVFRRDFHTCHFCGFRSKKYQTSVGTGSNLRETLTRSSRHASSAINAFTWSRSAPGARGS